jgi:rhodanese-related sulfurtransferase
LPKRLKEFGPNDRTVILCCQTGMRSSMAANALKKAGYSKLFNLGAWQNWNS